MAGEHEKDLQEILYLFMAVLGLIGLKQLWTTRVRPWIETTWGDLNTGHGTTIPAIGHLDQADLIGIAVLAVPFLIVLAIVASKVRRRRRAKARAARAATRATSQIAD